MAYARSPFRDFESYLRIVVDLDEDDIQLILKQYNANFVTYELDPGILARFGGNFGTLRFDEKSFFNTLLGFTPYWDYKPNNSTHADSSGVYTSDKILNLGTIDKIRLKCDVKIGRAHV